MASEQIQVGLIGCGGNMRNRIKNRLSTIPEVKIVALADTSEASVEALKEAVPELSGTPSHSDYRQLLETDGLDAVIISTPHKFHADQILDSLDAGKHVLAEKPLVCTVAEAKQVIAKRDETGRLLQLGYQRHFSPAFRFARQCVASGELGDIYMINAFQSQAWWNPDPAAYKWRFSKDLSGGGQLNDSGSHLMDIILWVTGLAPAEAFAYIDNRGAEIDVLTAASIRFENGALCNLSIVGEMPYKGMDEGLRIWGTKGHIAISGVGKNTITVSTADGQDPPRIATRSPADEELPRAAATPDHNFFAAIRGEEEIEVPAECGLRVIQASQAIWESASSGRPEKVKM